jgi:LmbE family N-acetylglucosaminyl deacetylase
MILCSIKARTALVIAPHPDDEALGCSGTLELLKGAGTDLTVIFLTNGEKLHGDASAEIARARQTEAVRSAGLLGCNETVFLDFPDGEVGKHIEEISRRLSEMITEKKPDVIFAPSPIDYHADHIAAAHIGLKLFDTSHSFKLAFYEVYSTLRFNCLVDITGAAEFKKQAILNYRTSLYGKPELYVDAALGLNAHRSMFVQKEGYYEAFYIVEKNGGLETVLDYLSYRDINP